MKRKTALITLLFAGTIALLPQIVSRGWIKNQMQAHLEAQLGGSVHVEKVSLSWFGKQCCKNVEWVDEQNGIAVKASSVAICSSLIDCLKYKERPLDVLVEGARVSCHANLRLIKKKRKKDLEMLFSPISATIQNRKIEFERTEIDVTESLKVVTWGNIDFSKHYMNLTLGLPPKTLKKLFKAKDLPEGYLLEIPVSTKLNGKALESHLIGYFLKNYATVTSLQR